MRMMRKVSFYLMVFFYCLAGLYHYINPDFYYPLIPDYLPYKEAINVLSGGLEILCGLALLIPFLRAYATFLIVMMLIAFIPSHIHFIIIGSCAQQSICVPPLVAWMRLVLVHPLLIFWAVYHHRS